MAQRRMFSKHIIDSDAFLDMPLSTQALYFHLSMRADDDGFINNPKKIMRMIGASEDELRVLEGKRFLLGFDTGVIVIKHWRIHNQIRKDRHHSTVYKEEFSRLEIKENGSYTDKVQQIESQDERQPNGNQMAVQSSIGKVSIVEDSIEQKQNNATQSAKADKNPYTLTNLAIKRGYMVKHYFPILFDFISNTKMEVNYNNLKGICEKIDSIDTNLINQYMEKYNANTRHYTPFALWHYLRFRNWYITADVFKHFDSWIKTWDYDTRAGYAKNGEYFIYKIGDMSRKEKIDTCKWEKWNDLMLEKQWS